MINALLKPFEDRLPENNRLERIWVQAKVNFLKRYYGSFVGVIWAFINPMVQFLVYYVIFGVIINSRDENRAVSLMLGLILWSVVIEGAQLGIRLLSQKRFIVENLQYNRMDLYISSILGLVFSLVINLFIFIIFAIFFDISFGLNILLFPLLIINLFLFVIALQLVLSVTYPIIMDVTHIWDKLKLGLFWFSGVVFPISMAPSPLKEIILWTNPFAGVFMNIKSIAVYNTAVDWQLFLWDFVLGFVLLFIAIQINKRLYFLAIEKL